MLSALAGAGLSLVAAPAHAGAQIEEPLADAVRTALSAAIASTAPPVPEFDDVDARMRYVRWLGAMSRRLSPKKPD
jgi:hypothetical protein